MDHKFTDAQRAAYDKMNRHGRTAYDHARWSGSTHEAALRIAEQAPGYALR